MSESSSQHPSTDEELLTQQLALQTALYLDLQKLKIRPGSTLKTVLKNARAQGVNDINADALEMLLSKNPELANATIDNMSWQMDGEKYKPNGMVACTFTLGDKTFVCYRGTPSGSWLDNGFGLAGIPEEEGGHCVPYTKDGVTFLVSPQQKAALDYAEEVLGNLDPKKIDIYVNGHSKGGNEASLVGLFFAEKLKAAYCFDGQGVSNQFIQACIDAWGLEGFNERRENLFGFNSQGDYVNPLGNTLIPIMNKLYFQSSHGDGLESLMMYHYITAFSKNGELMPTGAQNAFGKYVKSLSDKIMALEDGKREAASTAIMQICQKLLGKEPAVGGEEASIMDYIKGLGGTVIPILIDSLKSDEFQDLLKELDVSQEEFLSFIGGMMRSSKEKKKYGDLKPWAAAMGAHNFATNKDIMDYLKEHTESGKLEYLVRGALLKCREGTHARRLNLLKCHGVYITTHPTIHALNCDGGDAQNVPPFGICKSGTPPLTPEIDLVKDVPRDENGNKCGSPPGGSEHGHKCDVKIVGAMWLDTYPKTKIVDNGDKNPVDRIHAQEGDEPPIGEDSVTTLSFLVCQYGGLIEPFNSGQGYVNDPDEAKYAEQNPTAEHDCANEANTMHEKGGEGNPEGETNPIRTRYLGNEKLSEAASSLVDKCIKVDHFGGEGDFNWDAIEYFMQTKSSDDEDLMMALYYSLDKINRPEDMENFLNAGYELNLPDGEKKSKKLDQMTPYYEPTEVMSNLQSRMLGEQTGGGPKNPIKNTKAGNLLEKIANQNIETKKDPDKKEKKMITWHVELDKTGQLAAYLVNQDL